MNWYIRWTANHINAFALPEKAITMFAALEPAWTLHFTEAELDAATREMMFDKRKDKDGNNRLKWHEEHRTAVPEAVNKIRALEYSRRMLHDLPDHHVCGACGNTGIAIVPHPGKITGDSFPLPLAGELTSRPARLNVLGQPIYITLGVTCSCSIGRRAEAKQMEAVSLGSAKSRSITLSEYERYYPNYREVMFEIESVKKQGMARRTAAETAASEASIRSLLASMKNSIGTSVK